jgi:hypothetical protein
VSKDFSDEFLGRALKYLDSAEAFVKSEVPDFIRQYLEYEAFYHRMWVTWGFVPFGIFIIITIGILFACKDKFEDLVAGGFVAALFFLFLAFMTVPHSYFKLKKIEMAPKVYLIEALRK